MFPLEQFQLEHGQKPCSRNKNSPLVRLQNKYERYGTENNVLSGRGLARRPLSARRVHIKMTSHVAQCIHNTSILRSPRIVPVTNLNEAVPRTFHSARNMNACVPRTCSENILPGFCTENIYERALRGFKTATFHIFLSIANIIDVIDFLRAGRCESTSLVRACLAFNNFLVPVKLTPCHKNHGCKIIFITKT